MRARERQRHAEVQRKHAKRNREKGIPGKSDLASALLEAARRDFAANHSLSIGKPQAALWRRIVSEAVAVLGERGFDPQHSRKRFIRTLRPMPGGGATTGPDAEEGTGAGQTETTISG